MTELEEKELRYQHIVAELVRQRDDGLARCANFAGEIAFLQARVKELEDAAKPNPEPVS